MKRNLKKLNVMSIVHGRSELHLCSAIRSNLRIKHIIHSKDKGKCSIQVTSIMRELELSSLFNMKTLKEFSNKHDIQYDCKKKKLVNFKLFIIMDLDDCNPSQREKFKDKSMFKGHILYDYIEPIFNAPNLEATMKDIGIEVNAKCDYVKIFPTNKGDLDIQMARDLVFKLKKCKKTNLDLYIDYCIEIAEKNKY